MKSFTSIVGICGVTLLALLSAAGSQSTSKKLRVGTYDNRAVAVAYVASKYNPVREKTTELQNAKAAGDTARVEELEEWGPKHQRQLHRQGFGRVPVDDLLAHVEARLPGAAEKSGVDVIAFSCNYASPDVELVDVTNELVALFDPSSRTLEIIADLKNHEPLELDEIEQIKD